METKELIDRFENHHKTVLKLFDDAKTAAEDNQKKTAIRISDIEQKIARRPGASFESAQPSDWAGPCGNRSR